jgi:hypothetical protein
VNKLHLDEAISACDLQGSQTTQQLHNYKKMAQKATMSKEGMVIDVVNLFEEDGTATMFTSPLTEPLSSSLSSQLLRWSDIAAAVEQDKDNLGDNQQDSIPLQLQPQAAQHNNTKNQGKRQGDCHGKQVLQGWR